MHYLAVGAALEDLPNWVQLLGQAGIAGIVLWYFGAKLVPRLLDMQDKQLAAFQAEMKAERDATAIANRELRTDLQNLFAGLTEVRVAVEGGSGCKAAKAA